MYTNIDTTHALSTVAKYLRTNTDVANLSLPTDAVIAGLRIVMNHNLFQFDDTFWIQRTGTAMGTPPAPPYATIYFFIFERHLFKSHPNIHYYRRFIDDGFGIWICDENRNENVKKFQRFQTAMNSYCTLDWDFSPLVKSIPYLDLQLSIVNNQLEFDIYEKKLNLYLYLPPTSAQPPGVTKSLTFGMILRIFCLTSRSEQRRIRVQQFLRRLRVRGHNLDQWKNFISFTLQTASQRARLEKIRRTSQRQQQLTPLRSHATTTLTSTHHVSTKIPPLFLHIDYHPNNPPSRKIQTLFKQHVLSPHGEPELHLLRNNNNTAIGATKLTIAYHRPANLSNLLAPRCLQTFDFPASSFLDAGNSLARTPHQSLAAVNQQHPDFLPPADEANEAKASVK